jgi:hypothetical protein
MRHFRPAPFLDSPNPRRENDLHPGTLSEHDGKLCALAGNCRCGKQSKINRLALARV